MAVPADILRLLPSPPERAAPTRRSGAPELVQLSVRVPADLRAEVHDAAARSGLTMNDFVERALERAVAQATLPAMEMAGHLARVLQQRLADALADGSYDDAVAALARADPDLAT